MKIKKISSLLGLYSFGEAAAGKYAVIRAQLEREGMVISERDTQIASIVMANKLTVVTHNVKEFVRISRLKVEDWAVYHFSEGSRRYTLSCCLVGRSNAYYGR
ncbi:MAG: type II toxin-antitoxin system VapC family toxin [Deltaproteobacteria bacterium]|nr:type II toxin-antitoxin system VapC family toxin [Deltaproteobacteria bacterium]